jgi:hypothetical protein
METQQRFVVVLAVCLSSLFRHTFADSPVAFEVLLSFDYPGALETYANGVNDRGEVAGTFRDQSGALRGFVRFANGQFRAPIIDPNDTGGATIVNGMWP